MFIHPMLMSTTLNIYVLFFDIMLMNSLKFSDLGYSLRMRDGIRLSEVFKEGLSSVIFFDIFLTISCYYLLDLKGKYSINWEYLRALIDIIIYHRVPILYQTQSTLVVNLADFVPLLKATSIPFKAKEGK